MTVPNKLPRPEATPALSRLLADSALSRAALNACGFPLAVVDACIASRPLTFANPAFEGFLGYAAGEPLGRSLAAVLFRGDESLMHRLMAERSSSWELRVWRKDGSPCPVELSLGSVRGADGRVTHWVISLTDRSELERVRAELDALRATAPAE